MFKDIKINISNVVKEPYYSMIDFKVNMNIELVNILRRLYLNYLPMYVIKYDSINIVLHEDFKLNPVFHNDELKMRLEQIPVLLDIDVGYVLDNFNNLNENKVIEGKDVISYSLSQVNNNKFNPILASDLKLFKNRNKTENNYKNDFILCYLKEKQELNLTMNSCLKINNSRYLNAYHYYENEDKEENLHFVLENVGQLDGKTSYNLIIKILHKCVEDFITEFEKLDIKDKEINISTEKYIDSVYKIICWWIYEHNDILFASCDMEHFMNNKVNILLKSNKELRHIKFDGLLEFIKSLEIK